MTEDHYPDLEQSQRGIVDRCLDALYVSPAARRMIAEAIQDGWTIALDDRKGYDFHLDVDEKHIILDNNGLSEDALIRSNHFHNVLSVSLIRALRDAWQEKRHGGFDVKYGPEHVLMLERVRAADCDVMTVLVAWELRSEGSAELWRYLIGSEDGDIAMAFSGHLERDPSGTFTNAAMKSAFNQWFRSSERIDNCDHETLEYMDTLFEEVEEFEVFGNEKLTPVGVEILSCLPDKTAYIQGMGREVMLDPFYAGLSDPINQAHFAQIMYDLKVTNVQGVPFRDKALAFKIFPDGCFTEE